MPSNADQIWEDAGAPLIDELFGVTVTLTRNTVTTTGVTATADTVDYNVYDDNGFQTIATCRDYTIRTAAYAFAGTAVEPRRGDVIAETINGETQRFEVLPLGNKPAAYLLAGGMRWLIHTKRISK